MPGSNTIFVLRSTTPNIGNGIISEAMAGMLRQAFGSELNLVTLPSCGTDGAKGAGLTARTIYEVNQLADGLIVGPGNLFENGTINVELDALAALAVPAMVFSVSHGRVFDRSGELAPRTDTAPEVKVTALCRAADPVLVRDAVTRDRLAAAGVDGAKIGGCPALFFDPSALPPRDPSSPFVDSVLISVRNPKLMSIPYSAQGHLYQDVRCIIDRFRARGETVRLLCHDYRDLPFARAFPDVPTSFTEDPIRILSWLRDCRLNITFRLHAFLGSLAVGARSIPFTYDERAISLIDTIGFSEWAISLLHSRSPLSDVDARCEDLARLEFLRGQARPVWDRLRQTMTDGIRRFASRVAVYKNRCTW